MDNTASSVGLSRPPEGVIAGEDVPRENERGDKEEALIQECVGLLKSKGEPFTKMRDSEIRERAIELLQKKGVIK